MTVAGPNADLPPPSFPSFSGRQSRKGGGFSSLVRSFFHSFIQCMFINSCSAPVVLPFRIRTRSYSFLSLLVPPRVSPTAGAQPISAHCVQCLVPQLNSLPLVSVTLASEMSLAVTSSLLSSRVSEIRKPGGG